MQADQTNVGTPVQSVPGYNEQKSPVSIDDPQMPSTMGDSLLCPLKESDFHLEAPGCQWTKENWVGELIYHGNLTVYKQKHGMNQWGSECAYNKDGVLVL